MTDKEIEKFKQVLKSQQQELVQLQEDSRDSTRPVNLDQSAVGRLSRMDAIQSQAMALESTRRRKIQLTRIEAALERIKKDDFGFCASCEEDIDIRRLEIDPANPLCISCAETLQLK